MAALSAPTPDIIHAALLEADQQIGARIQAKGKGSGAAVMACLWAQDSQAWQVALVGDCKVLHMQRQSGRWHRLWASPEQTYDYAGLQPPEGVSPNSPANMVGCGLAMPALTHTLQIRNRERLVVCSDGFASQCDGAALAQRVADAASPLEPGLAQAWCEAARDAGSEDDITVLIVERHDQFTPLARITLAAATALAAGAAALAWSLA
jgi:serine/threonine protein phosphatase PrpC